ncbi:transposable element Tcb1 transposase [Trichonephila clavipes]|nr:transposable element Tcb1 transposase [Trichonephila clavipes]
MHVSDLDKGRILAYGNCGLSYHSIASRVGRDPMTAAECAIDGFWTVIRNAVLDLNGSPSLATKKTGILPAWPLWMCSLVMSPESRIGVVCKRTSVYTNSSTTFCLQHQDDRNPLRWHRGERTLTVCIRHRHTGPSPGMMVWGAIGYTYRSPLVSIDGTLNSVRYSPGVLRPVALSFIRVLRNPTFKQDNARPHVTDIVRTFLDTENVRLLNWPARSPNLSPIGNVWSMVTKREARHHTPVTNVD